MTDANEKWLKSPEGKEEYLMWMSTLIERAEKICGIPIILSGSGEPRVKVILDPSEIPMAVKRNPNYIDSEQTVFYIEFTTKDNIIKSIDKIAQNRSNKADDEEFIFSDEEVYEKIEEAIVKDLCKNAVSAKDLTLQVFKEAKGFKVILNSDGRNEIIPLSEAEIEENKEDKTDKKKDGFFKRVCNKVWAWYNGSTTMKGKDKNNGTNS